MQQVELTGNWTRTGIGKRIGSIQGRPEPAQVQFLIVSPTMFELEGIAGVEPQVFSFSPSPKQLSRVTPGDQFQPHSKTLTLYTVCFQLKTQMIIKSSG